MDTVQFRQKYNAEHNTIFVDSLELLRQAIREVPPYGTWTLIWRLGHGDEILMFRFRDGKSGEYIPPHYEWRDDEFPLPEWLMPLSCSNDTC